MTHPGFLKRFARGFARRGILLNQHFAQRVPTNSVGIIFQKLSQVLIIIKSMKLFKIEHR